MQAELEALRAGVITFDQFQRQTHSQWEKYASMLLRRWRSPEGVEREDLVQEMMIAVWKSLPDWRPDGGKPLGEWVTYRAIDKAKKWLHKQRDAKRRDDKAPGRYPLRFTQVVRGDYTNEPEDQVIERLVAVGRAPVFSGTVSVEGPGLEDIEQLSVVTGGLTDPRDRYCLVALVRAGGDVDLAAIEIYDDARTRLAFRLHTLKTARRVVAQALRKAATVQQTAA
jgi:DNA-directed RNA polymerase specialized sigma24 family protein